MLKKVGYFFRYVFRCRPPEIVELHYADYVISNKSYFLVSWKCRFGYKLSIKPMYSTYFRGSGSAYILIPAETDKLEVKFSNVWHSRIVQVNLFNVRIEPGFDFNLKPNFRQWRSPVNSLPTPKLSSNKITLRNTQAKLSTPTISLQNLTFLNPKLNGK